MIYATVHNHAENDQLYNKNNSIQQQQQQQQQ